MTYIAEIPFELDEQQCTIGLISAMNKQGSYSYNAPSDLDYYGYSETDWDLLVDGAAIDIWTLNAKQIDAVEEAIWDYLDKNDEPNDDYYYDDC
jgi:hypothetical protein